MSRSLLQRAERAAAHGQWISSIEICGVALLRCTNDALERQLRRLRANAYQHREDWSASNGELLRLSEISTEPEETAGVLAELAACETKLGKPERGIALFQRAIRLSSNAGQYWKQLGELYRSRANYKDAIDAYQQALAAGLDSADLRAELGSCLLEISELGAAKEQLERAVAAKPHHRQARVALGLWAYRAGNDPLALAHFGAGHSHADQHDHALERFNLAAALLRSGNYARGFREYESRRARPTGPWRGVPFWQGGALSNGRLLLWAEQGYGDTLQFVRFARLAQARGARTALLAPPRLVRLLKTCQGFDEIEPLTNGLVRGARQCPLMSLPHVLGLEGVDRGAVPYLTAEPELRTIWQSRLNSQGISPAKPTVALCWQGNPHFGADRERSMPLRNLAPLIRAHQHRVQFISVQKNAGQEQLDELPPDLRILDVGERLDLGDDAFCDTAAVLAETDLLITTDTAIAHLGGAMGVETWLLLAFSPDFRWGMNSPLTDWYPSMTLFRQLAAGDWHGAVNKLSAHLETFLREKGVAA